MVFFKTPCIPFLDCECFSERTFFKNCLELFSSTLHLNFYQLVKSSVQMMGENTRRVAKIISFEVSSVNEMIKSNVILCKHTHTHTHRITLFYRKALLSQNLPPPPPQLLLFLSILFSYCTHIIPSLQYQLVQCVCVNHHRERRQRRRREELSLQQKDRKKWCF